MRVLAVNCGSSSLKFDLLDVDAGSSRVKRVAGGIVDRVGVEAKSTLDFGGNRLERSKPIADHARAFEEAAGMLQEAGLLAGIEAIGHRVVHGGARLREPALVDEAVIEAIGDASDLAPLHDRPALAAINAARAQMGATPMAATFDTAFYAALPRSRLSSRCRET